MALKHNKISLKSDTVDPSIIQPSDWNDDHVLDAAGIIHSKLAGLGIDSVIAGQNYHYNLRRKFNASNHEEYEFVKPVTVVSTDYDFPAQTPAQSLTANVNNAITLTPVPLGISGTNVVHYIRIIDGIAGNEVCLITGGTAISGSATGTITFVPTLAHTTGNYTIKSATAGIQEAIAILPSRGGSDDIYGGGTVIIPKGTHETFATITVRGHGKKIHGIGRDVSTIFSSYKAGPLVYFEGIPVGEANEIKNLSIRGDGTAATNFGLHLHDQNGLMVSGIGLYYTGSGMKVTGDGNSAFNTYRHIFAISYKHDGILIDVAPASGTFFDITLGGDSTSATNGFHIIRSAGTVISHLYTIFNGNGVLIDPSSTDVLWTEFVNCYLDASAANALAINPSGTGRVIGCKFTHMATAFTGNDGGGVFIGPNGTVCGLQFIGNVSIINAGHGYWILGGSDITFTDCKALGNSSINNNTRDGMSIEGGSNIKIIGGIYAQAWTQANSQRVGIGIGAATSNVEVIGAVVTPNITNGLTNGSNSARVYHTRGAGHGITPITAGASPWTYTAGETPEFIMVSSGVVSEVVVNGYPIYGEANHTYFLNPHDTIKITYSVAPFFFSTSVI